MYLVSIQDTPMNNYLALLELVARHARATGQEAQIVDKIHGLARIIGIPEEDILDALASDAMLVIYEP